MKLDVLSTGSFISLMYHDFGESSLGGYTLAWKRFCNQLDYLQDNGVSGKGFGWIDELPSLGDKGCRAVVLSFDDGYRSFLKAADLISERGMQGTFFLTRDLCRHRTDFLQDSEIRELASKAEVGTHGLTHEPLNRLSRDRLQQELADSKQWLEDVTGREIRYMSAPGGYWNAGCQRLALESGYSLVGTSREWWNQPKDVARRRQVNRVAVRTHFTPTKFAQILALDRGFFALRRLRSVALAPVKAVRSRWEPRKDLKPVRQPLLSKLPAGVPSGTSERRMQVCYVFSRFPAPSETFAGNDVRALRKLGVEVAAVNLRHHHPRSSGLLQEWGLQEMQVDGVTAAKLLSGAGRMLRSPSLAAYMLGTILKDNWRRPDHLGKSLLALPRVFQVHRTLGASPPDVLHLFWGHYASLLGLLVRRTHPTVVVTAFLGAYDLHARYRTGGRLANQADCVFTHARANLPLLARQGVSSERVKVVYRGVDLGRLQYRDERKTRFRIATAGRLVPVKGMAEVIKVFARIQQQLPEASLSVVGDGPERGALERCVSELRLRGVEFTGYLPHREVFARLCQAELFLFLSRKEDERLPNVVKEAMAARCACLVSRTTGIEELVKHDQHGLVVEPGDLDAAVAGALTLLQEPVLCERMVGEALEHLERHFDLKQSMTRYRDTWEDCLAGRRGAPIRSRAAGGAVQHHPTG